MVLMRGCRCVSAEWEMSTQIYWFQRFTVGLNNPCPHGGRGMSRQVGEDFDEEEYSSEGGPRRDALPLRNGRCRLSRTRAIGTGNYEEDEEAIAAHHYLVHTTLETPQPKLIGISPFH